MLLVSIPLKMAVVTYSDATRNQNGCRKVSIRNGLESCREAFKLCREHIPERTRRVFLKMTTVETRPFNVLTRDEHWQIVRPLAKKPTLALVPVSCPLYLFFLCSVSSGASPRKCWIVAATLNAFPPRSIANFFSCPGVPPSIDQTCPIVTPCTGMSFTASR